MPGVRVVQEDNDAFRAGDLAALRAAVDDPGSIPNGWLHPAIFGSCLVYAIYHSPAPFIRTLLEPGADTRPANHMGFPPSRTNPHPGAPARADVPAVIELLLEFGADPNERGINDYTPLHMAVAEGHIEAVRLLLSAVADPACRTRIDDGETPCTGGVGLTTEAMLPPDHANTSYRLRARRALARDWRRPMGLAMRDAIRDRDA